MRGPLSSLHTATWLKVDLKVRVAGRTDDLSGIGWQSGGLHGFERTARGDQAYGSEAGPGSCFSPSYMTSQVRITGPRHRRVLVEGLQTFGI